MTIRANITHVRKAKICLAGARAWFPVHGMPWTEFLKEGCSVEFLEATGDPMALKVAAFAREEATNG